MPESATGQGAHACMVAIFGIAWLMLHYLRHNAVSVLGELVWQLAPVYAISL